MVDISKITDLSRKIDTLESEMDKYIKIDEQMATEELRQARAARSDADQAIQNAETRLRAVNTAKSLLERQIKDLKNGLQGIEKEVKG